MAFAAMSSIASDKQETPSLELLEYLAEFAESEQGDLIDPIDQQNTPGKSISYREYMKEQTQTQ